MKYVTANRKPYSVCISNTLINQEFLNLDYKQADVGGDNSCVGAVPCGCPSYLQAGVGELTVGELNLIPNIHCILKNTRTVSD